MVFNGNYSRDGAIKAVAESMGTTIKQATRYVSKALSNPTPTYKKKKVNRTRKKKTN